MSLSGASLYMGAAIAVGLFDVFPPVVVAWFRVSAAGLILLALYRPPRSAFVGKPARAALLYGLMTMLMNMTFYQAINMIPLGTAVAIEFIGPVAIAAIGSRSVRDWLALVLAFAGVLVISGATWSSSGTGILWAIAAGVLWAGYILAGSRISSDVSTSRASMSVGFAYAALLGLPAILWLWPDSVSMPAITIVGLAAGLGLMSAAIPYSLDQVVLRMAGPAYFAILQAILPLVAALVGAVALRQWLSASEMLGIALVILAVFLRQPAGKK